MAKNKIKSIDEKGNTFAYRDIQDAASCIKSLKEYRNMEEWKIQLYISYALNTKGKAFKYKWVKIK